MEMFRRFDKDIYLEYKAVHHDYDDKITLKIYPRKDIIAFSTFIYLEDVYYENGFPIKENATGITVSAYSKKQVLQLIKMIDYFNYAVIHFMIRQDNSKATVELTSEVLKDYEFLVALDELGLAQIEVTYDEDGRTITQPFYTLNHLPPLPSQLESVGSLVFNNKILNGMSSIFKESRVFSFLRKKIGIFTPKEIITSFKKDFHEMKNSYEKGRDIMIERIEKEEKEKGDDLNDVENSRSKE